jgi:hypothetical protein
VGIKDGDFLTAIQGQPVPGLADFYSIVRQARLGYRLQIQVALSTTLLFGMALFTRTLYNLRAEDLGYSPERLTTARIDPIAAGYKGDEIGEIAQRVLERLRTLPGITAASYSDNAYLPATNPALTFA